MRWWGRCLIRELPPLTVKAPGVWHVCGTHADALATWLVLPIAAVLTRSPTPARA